MAYANGQVIGKDETDKQGQKKNAKIPLWVQKNAAVPAHVEHLKCYKIELPFAHSKNKWCVLIPGVLSKTECDEMIAMSEEQGYEDALVNIGYGRQQKLLDFRNCKRMMIDNKEMVDCLWRRLHRFIPTYFRKFKKIAFNERLRFLRYNKQEFFAPHFDGRYTRPNGEFSQITMLLYLNADFKGATTNFLDSDDDTYHAPKITPGMVIMFQHDIYHEGAMLEYGTKYIVRTDVMFSKTPYSRKEQEIDKENVAIQYHEYKDLHIRSKKNDDSCSHNDDEKENEK